MWARDLEAEYCGESNCCRQGQQIRCHYWNLWEEFNEIFRNLEIINMGLFLVPTQSLTSVVINPYLR